ncbi:succinyl-diaminopimelate desuccinylase [Corynebacterium sp. 13CS0277]|uniref:succinyl-diaminopimelate desuccinylase n=1 Tax=Corynebacterium sp. 13CS0277 TaxID=2071994 RepID=UPI000D031EA5|nr:succinyl-diaminopimelate desuccinylase [Corynebacterium sp. 13CS0277]PRQ12284.1 succinyl-diaminopimelate desuccinylase [Corynebacterium sp. 13CS0277]
MSTDDTAAQDVALDLRATPVELTRQLVDIPSPSHHEAAIADAVEAALRQQAPQLEVLRFNNNVLARTTLGLDSRVILAGHLDTVPIADNVPSTWMEEDGQRVLHGCGTVDMKSGDAVFLSTVVELLDRGQLTRDVTLIMYEGEEVASQYNGLGHISEHHPEWLRGDVAILGEPSGGVIEAGCQGTIRLKVTAHGVRAHSARAWMGRNAMHVLSPVIARIAAYEPQRITIDGCEYREGINIVKCESFVATNTIPDEAWLFVNYRFAPNKSVEDAMAHLLEVLDLGDTQRHGADFSVEVDDAVGGALPGLAQPAAAELVAATGGNFRAKYGWTDVSRFSALGIPAVNFGPGDPALCHKRDERCPVTMIEDVAATLRTYLSS